MSKDWRAKDVLRSRGYSSNEIRRMLDGRFAGDKALDSYRDPKYVADRLGRTRGGLR